MLRKCYLNPWYLVTNQLFILISIPDELTYALGVIYSYFLNSFYILCYRQDKSVFFFVHVALRKMSDFVDDAWILSNGMEYWSLFLLIHKFPFYRWSVYDWYPIDIISSDTPKLYILIYLHKYIVRVKNRCVLLTQLPVIYYHSVSHWWKHCDSFSYFCELDS